ncbi:tyrosine-type recombinase/integrase [Schinkia azotoformans]|uniref:Integrase family protein n=1 Tax=Schinkia azotoformans LMG 9581 TaxID=1131731 RepID=K6D3G1_SCHAZ|nr:tyrosine-type recombinase/integrase [Schinkia azotoformans]EKN62804.1 integrase family protein [Schinkia azotoformans LMG 9581]MEC1639178.1 tyrosine-type recombinase/integrase [Schinkia azotoformans]MEC1945766.1 tyrosine-type recombinase/integrase [Schinkia azotoformans]
MNQYEQKTDLYFELKGSPESTKESYSRRMQAFTKYLQENNKSIENMTHEDVQQYILYLKKEKGLSAGTINNYISAIRFFYTYVLEKDWNKRKVPRMKRSQKLPVIPAKEDVLSLLDSTENLKHKAILELIYGSGLRVSEVAKLKISDICSKTMRIRVENAKHNTNRYTILSDLALKVLRNYFREYFSNTSYKLDDWLFPGQKQGEHIHVKTIKNTIIKLRNKLELDPKISAHTLRHCFATHSLEDGVEPVLIQQMLGHTSLKTTTAYLHMTSKSLMGVKSPLDTRKDREV